jgi:RsiW-degrading membrane proteinase PrsW (M82 family)
MNGFGSLAFLVLTAALPVMVCFVWLKIKGMGTLWFVSLLLTGALTLVVAALLQSFFPSQAPLSGMWGVIFKLFIEIAGTEEGSRLLFLTLFFKLSARFPVFGASVPDADRSSAAGGNSAAQGNDSGFYFWSLAAGLVAGLGFAFFETISYAAADLRIALLRGFSAAPLHGACGIRAGFAAGFIVRGRDDAGTGGGRNLVSALIIHGMYNFLLISPGVPAFVPFTLAFISLIVPFLAWRMRSRRPV